MKDALDLDLVLISADSPNDNYTSAILKTHASSDNLQIITFIFLILSLAMS